jgi:hypothetical protein
MIWIFFFRTKYFDKKYIQNINRHQISHFKNIRVRVRVMVFNATFNNISVLVQRSVLLEEETEENYRPVESHWQTLSHNVVSSTPPLSVNRTHKVVVIDTDCIGSYKSNYHKITATMAPLKYYVNFSIYFMKISSDIFSVITTCHANSCNLCLISHCADL